MSREPAGLFLFMGFLGSGKTTLINRLLCSLAGKRVGVIVNDWGKIPVDGSLIARKLGEEETQVPIIELAGGQIFCACMSASFLSAMESLSKLDLEYIFVETSGLAKPSTLGEVVREAETRCPDGVAYAGSICVVDATRFLALRSVATVIDEQVAFADRFVITKTESAGAATVQTVRETLAGIRPGAPIIDSASVESYSPILALLEMPGLPSRIPRADPRFAGWGPHGRPRSSEIVSRKSVDLPRLRAFLESIADGTYRVKGFLRVGAEGRWVYVDCVEGNISLRDFATPNFHAPNEGLTVIWRDRPLPQRELALRWEEFTGAPWGTLSVIPPDQYILQ